MTDQTTTEPTRPFESLDWYRQASRSGSGGLGSGARLLDWARGIGFLTLHVSIYALGIVTMFVLNLLRSPDRIWVDRAIPIWTLIVIIHAVLVGLLWAIGQLNREDDGPLLIVSDANWRDAATWTRGESATPPPAGPAPPAFARAPATGTETTQHFRPSPTMEPSVQPRTGSAPPPRGESGTDRMMQFRPTHVAESHAERPVTQAPVGAASEWSGWESDVPQRLDPNDPERASWQEAEAAARRGRTATSPPPDPPGDAPPNGS
ncbi:MAG: hypothetical protein H0W23_02115 [Chloroflexia bacterium]|nr:hypothetical protein [Chloroflexia bacterium]